MDIVHEAHYDAGALLWVAFTFTAARVKQTEMRTERSWFRFFTQGPIGTRWQGCHYICQQYLISLETRFCFQVHFQHNLLFNMFFTKWLDFYKITAASPKVVLRVSRWFQDGLSLFCSSHRVGAEQLKVLTCSPNTSFQCVEDIMYCVCVWILEVYKQQRLR